MSKREDQGKNLLRMLQAAQPAPAPPDSRQGHFDEANSSEYPSPSYPVPAATDVRSAAAGEQRYPDPASAAASDRSSYLLPRPGATATTPVRSVEGNVRMLHQRSPQLAPEKAPLQQERQQQQQGQQEQQQHFQINRRSQNQPEQQQGAASPPPPVRSRSGSIAAEQERFLKKFLAIGGDIGSNNNSNSNNTGPPSSVPFSPPPPQRHQKTAVVPQTPPPPPAATPPRRPTPVTPSATSENTKPHGGRARNGNSNQGRGGGGGRDGRGRGGRTPQQRASGGREARKGRGRGGGGGGGGGRNGPAAPASSSKYAWSAFQNSPDPKSIPIPSLRHFNLDASPGEESAGPEVGLASLDWRESIQQPPQEQAQDSGSDVVAAGYDASVASGVLRTPPPPAARVARTDAAASNGNINRSSAKKAEEDIKRMLRLG